MTTNELTENIVNYCKNNNIKKIYICGNGGAGKTTLSKSIVEYAKKYGNVNLISVDDFMVDTDLRKNSKVKWLENNIEYCDRYTSSNKESYFLKNIYEILYNLEQGNDCYYFPRRYIEKNNIRKLYSLNFLTVIEGVGTAFLDIDRNESLSVFLKCSKEVEIQRRIDRTRVKNRDKTELYSESRSSQYRVNVLPKADEFDIVVQSDKNFDFTIDKGVFNIK